MTKARHDVKMMKEEKGNLEKKVEQLNSFDTEREKCNITMLEENRAFKDELDILKLTAKVNSLSLLEEIKTANESRTCEVCKKCFQSGRDMKSHSERCHQQVQLEQYISNLQSQISSQK